MKKQSLQQPLCRHGLSQFSSVGLVQRQSSKELTLLYLILCHIKQFLLKTEKIKEINVHSTCQKSNWDSYSNASFRPHLVQIDRLQKLLHVPTAHDFCRKKREHPLEIITLTIALSSTPFLSYTLPCSFTSLSCSVGTEETQEGLLVEVKIMTFTFHLNSINIS